MSCDLSAYHSLELVSVRVDPHEIALFNAPVLISPLASWICQELEAVVASRMTRSGRPSPFRSKNSTSVEPGKISYRILPGDPELMLYQFVAVCPWPDIAVHLFVGANPLPVFL